MFRNAVLLAIIVFACINYYLLAQAYTDEEVKRGGKGYVSDEVWYVSSARNLLYKIFNTKPRLYGRPAATIVYGENANVTYSLLHRLASKYGVEIVDPRYNKLKKAVYVEANTTNAIESFARELENYTVVKTVVWGWRLADAENIQEYLNLEHPPLVKYLIAVSMVTLGDYPTYWRIPCIAAGILLVLFSYLLATEVMKDELVALIVAAAVAVEPLTRALASTALLDIYVALFSVLAAYFLVKKRYLLSLLIIALGATAKFNTLFMLVPYLFIVVRDYLRRKGGRPDALVYGTAYYFLVVLLIVFAFQVLVATPIIGYLGLSKWLDYSLFGAIKWHTSIKCVGAGCPPASSPWEWFFGINSFPIYFFPDGQSIHAQGISFFWTITLAYAIAFLPAYRLSRSIRWCLVLLYGLVGGYLLLWIIGGRTQYSFYSIQILPFVYITLVSITKDVVLNRRLAVKTLDLWKSFFTYMWRAILKIILVE